LTGSQIKQNYSLPLLFKLIIGVVSAPTNQTEDQAIINTKNPQTLTNTELFEIL